ncbi:hypothetical protein A4A49_55126 [Nicotiana attenuata]|uniref:Uncharacterized protein n=1 Tax=Nicotiana attenuata TaxID=49451 RepID=A0A1J6KCR6_NICAT|nr:hypothetical protein A4A49_55126 [Nicotiana attenuata]
MDVESSYDGYLPTIIVPEGGSAPMGSTIALLAESEEEVSLVKAKIPTYTSSSSQETTTPAVAITEEVVYAVATSAKVSPSNAGPAKMWKEIFTPNRIIPLKEQGNRKRRILHTSHE